MQQTLNEILSGIPMKEEQPTGPAQKTLRSSSWIGYTARLSNSSPLRIGSLKKETSLSTINFQAGAVKISGGRNLSS